MAYTKKKWVNVPDPSNPPSIPEGQGALARFDADNMNRIEDGVDGVTSAFESHRSNSNPHGITPLKIGLGNVPNVSTNDQTPTYTEAASLTNLTSGEKLNVAFGKIKKAIADFMLHSSDTTGVGTSTKYGHLKITDATNSTATGTAASAKALKSVNDRINLDGYTLLKSQNINTTITNPGQQKKSHFQLTGFDLAAYEDYKLVFNGSVSAISTSDNDSTSGRVQIGVYPTQENETNTSGSFIELVYTLAKSETAIVPISNIVRKFHTKLGKYSTYKSGAINDIPYIYTTSGTSAGSMSWQRYSADTLYCFIYSTGMANYTVNLTVDIYGKGVIS